VLSLPPAFVLSQDQTLKFEELCSSGVATGWSMRIDESQAYFDNYVEAWLHITHDFSVLCVRVSTNRQDAAACVSLSFFHNVKEPESLSTFPPLERRSTTGPSHLAPDVQSVRSWKRA
jgi:hypothetical protein